MGHVRHYTLVKTGGVFKLCRILNVYEDHNKAQKDLAYVVCHGKNELEILEEYDNKFHKYI